MRACFDFDLFITYVHTYEYFVKSICANSVDLTEVFIITSHIEKKIHEINVSHFKMYIALWKLSKCTLAHFWQNFGESNGLILQKKLI